VKNQPVRLQLETLEDRRVPATAFGTPWPDGAHLTLSYVPDGTATGNGPSNLFQKLNTVAPSATWQAEILRALQSWAANANINIGVVSDGGEALGAPGAIQGDSRFGDIRIAAVPLPANTIATASPFTWTGSTWNGDLLLNSNYNFGVNGSGQYDLFTVAMHEAGHVFGFADTTSDKTSAMYSTWTGISAGPAAQDVAALQTLYGQRSPDQFDAVASNNSFATATPLSNNLSQTVLNADLTTVGDVDYYKVTVPLTLGLFALTAGVRTSGLSSLQPTLTIYNSSMRVVGSSSASAPGGDLSVTAPTLLGGTYYIKVDGAAGAFGVGAYQMSFGYQLLGLLWLPKFSSILGFLNNGDLNNVLGSALDLNTSGNNATTARGSYLFRETMLSTHDQDFFRITAPSAAGVNGYTLSAVAFAAEVNGLKPVVHLYDSAGRPVAATVLANGSGTYSIQTANATPGSTYYLEVDAQGGSPLGSGNFTIMADFDTSVPLSPDALGTETLTSSQPSDTATLTASNNQLFNFSLAAASANANMCVTLSVTDATGATVLTLNADAGQPPSTAVVYLKAGSYKLTYTARNKVGGPIADVTFSAFGLLLSDQMGPYSTSTPSGGSSGSSGSTYTYAGSSQSTSGGGQYWF
jgi:hypothetical protein